MDGSQGKAIDAVTPVTGPDTFVEASEPVLAAHPRVDLGSSLSGP